MRVFSVQHELLVLLVVAIQSSSFLVYGQSRCTLDALKDVAKNACEHIADRVNRSDPFHVTRSHLGYHLGHHGTRNRRHATTHHEYHKLNNRLTHKSAHGYLEISYSKPVYEFVKRLAGSDSVSDWTADLLEIKGFKCTRPPPANTEYIVDGFSEDEFDFVPVTRDKRSVEESLEQLRNRRANHAKIAYCCEHIDNANCRDHLCYV